MYAEDTIVAPATPAGKGAVAIVRLSGGRRDADRLDAVASVRRQLCGRVTSVSARFATR